MATSSTVPFTPAGPRFKSSHQSLGLSNKQGRDIQTLLYSAHKPRRTNGVHQEHYQDVEEEDEQENEVHASHARRTRNGAEPPSVQSSSSLSNNRRASDISDDDRWRASRREEKAPAKATTSHPFLAETSFHQKPLASRIVPPQPDLSILSPVEVSFLNSQPEPVPFEIQEALVLEDLQSVLLGVEGSLILWEEGYDPLDERLALNGAGWRVDEGLDPSLLSLLKRILPLATHYMGIQAFIDSRCGLEYGKTNHALASGLRSLLTEYSVLLTQLEKLWLHDQHFSLQQAWSHLSPCLHKLSLLHALTLELVQAEGKFDDEDETKEDESLPDDDSDAEMNERLGLGGAGLKDLMKSGNGGRGQREEGGLVKGGEVLGLIWERLMRLSGDATATQLYSTLLRHASQPYAVMILRWISTGILVDKYEEFMVRETGSITKGSLEMDYTDEYWDRRYTLRDGSSLKSTTPGAPSTSSSIPLPRNGTNRLPGGACVPPFLEGWKHKILLAGKYLNVIKECGVDARGDSSIWDGKEEIDLEDSLFHDHIEAAYIRANQTLLKMLLEEQQLVPHLRSMKHYFFLDQSDFFTHFLDTSMAELHKTSRQASLVKLQSLLDLTLRNPSTVTSSDPYKDDLKVTMASQTLSDFLISVVNKSGNMGGSGDGDVAPASVSATPAQSDKERRDKDRDKDKKTELLAINAFQLDYTVEFPLSLVISRKTITRYQIVFRFLLQLRHLEQSLSAMFLHQSKHKPWKARTSNPRFEAWKQRMFLLRSKMNAFIGIMLSFVTQEVLEPNWRQLEVQMAKVKTVDQLLKDHVDFLDTCLKQCMLTKQDLITIIAKLFETTHRFVNYSRQFDHQAEDGYEEFVGTPLRTKKDGTLEERVTDDGREKFLAMWELNFSHNVKAFMQHVTYVSSSDNVAVLPLVGKLRTLLDPRALLDTNTAL